MSARFAQRLKQKRGVSVDARAGKLGLVIRGFGHSVEAEVAVLCDGVNAHSSAGTLASWSPVLPRGLVRLGRGAARPRARSRETVIGLYGPGGGPVLEAAGQES